MYKIDNEKLTKRPEMRLGDKIFQIDNRLSVFLEMMEMLKNPKEGHSEFEIVMTLGLGRAAFEEIKEMDLPYNLMNDIVIIILAAIQDLPQEEAHRRFRNDNK